MNFFHNINPNIINNITIKNNNKFLCKSENKESTKNLSFSSEKSERKFDLEQIEMHSEINFFYRAKYLNLEEFTSGEFSRNEELRKQSLNFIKVFLEIDKKRNKKMNKLNYKNIQINKINNPYTNNYQFRYKFNIDKQRKNSLSNTPKSIAIKKQNNYITQFLLSINGEEKSDNNSLALNKNNYSKEASKSTFSKRIKKRNIKIRNSFHETSYSQNKNAKKDIANASEKFDYSIEQQKENKDNIGFLKLPIKIKTINEWESENISNEKIIKNDLSKSNSEDKSISNTFYKGINSLYTHKNDKKSNTINLNSQSSNE